MQSSSSAGSGPAPRRTYDAAFRAEALRRVQDGQPAASVARALRLAPSVLARWLAAARPAYSRAVVGWQVPTFQWARKAGDGAPPALASNGIYVVGNTGLQLYSATGVLRRTSPILSTAEWRMRIEADAHGNIYGFGAFADTLDISCLIATTPGQASFVVCKWDSGGVPQWAQPSLGGLLYISCC